MVKQILVFIIIISQSIVLSAQSSKNMSQVGHLSFPGKGGLNDVWGYVDGTGKEYALVGLNQGVSVVDISTPASPVEVFYQIGANSIWRDLKVWNNKAYITNESFGGLMIIDLSTLPGNTNLSVTNYNGDLYPFNTAHNLYIDENGICYIFGANNGVGGAIMLDLNVPTSDPNFELGRYNEYYLHDGMVRGDTLWGGAIDDGFFAAIDVSNKALPVTMATQTTPSFFTHNGWISDDGQTLYTGDEKSDAYLASYDVSDLSNITELDRIQSSPGQLVIPHNVHFYNDYIVTSYYRDGVVIHDVSNPNVMVEVGHFDTSPLYSGNNFNGCWGVYPWLPSGLVIATDIEEGLYVLNSNYTRACYLEGTITSASTSNALDGVSVEILLTSDSTNSNVNGTYKTGLADAGTYDVVYSKAGYVTDTVFNVNLVSGNTTVVDVQLDLIISVSEINKNSSVKVTPNPFVNIVNIKTEENYNKLTIEIHDITGAKVEGFNFHNTSMASIKTRYKKGVYIISVFGDEQLIKTERLIKF